MQTRTFQSLISWISSQAALEAIFIKLKIALDYLQINLRFWGKAVAQYVQDGYYKPQYIAALLDAFLGGVDRVLSLEDILIDLGSNITLLHLLSIIPFPTPDRSISPGYHADDNDTEDIPIIIDLNSTSLLQQVLHLTPSSLTNNRDFHGDTPLHYVSAACEIQAIEALLSAGANPHAKNHYGLRPIDVLCWTSIFCEVQSFRVKFDTGILGSGYSKFQQKEMDMKDREVNGEMHEEYLVGMRRAFEVFGDIGCGFDGRLKRLVLGWEFAREGNSWEERRGFVVERVGCLKEENGDEKDSKNEGKKDRHVMHMRVEEPMCKIFLEIARF